MFKVLQLFGGLVQKRSWIVPLDMLYHRWLHRSVKVEQELREQFERHFLVASHSEAIGHQGPIKFISTLTR